MIQTPTKRQVLAGIGTIGLWGTGCKPAPSHHFAELFDQILRLLAEHHYDYAKIKGLIETDAVRYRQIATEADSRGALYFDSLFPFISALAKTSSHLALNPGALTLPEGRWIPLPAQPRGAPPPLAPADLGGLGAALAWTGEAYRVVAITPDSDSTGLKLHQNLQITAYPQSIEGKRLITFQEVETARLLSISYQPNPKPPVVWSKVLDRRTAYLRFDQFTHEIVAQAIEAIDHLPPQIILDLRANVGGNIRAAGKLWSRIMPSESDILDTYYQGKNYRFKTPAGPKTDLRFAVLVSPMTASSAEITASALAHHTGAPLLGEASAGSVLLSQYYPLSDGGKLQIPIAKLNLPYGADLEGSGLTPDLKLTSEPPHDAFVRKAYDMMTG